MSDKQKILLESLKESNNIENFPFGNIKNLTTSYKREISTAINDLSVKQEFEILKAFAEWGLKQYAN